MSPCSTVAAAFTDSPGERKQALSQNDRSESCLPLSSAKTPCTLWVVFFG